MSKLRGVWRRMRPWSRYCPRRAHFLPEGKAVSLCRRVPYTLLKGPTDDVSLRCKVCLRMLAKRGKQ